MFGGKGGKVSRCRGVFVSERLLLTPKHCFDRSPWLLWSEQGRPQAAPQTRGRPLPLRGPERPARHLPRLSDLLVVVSDTPSPALALGVRPLVPGSPVAVADLGPDDRSVYGGCAEPTCAVFFLERSSAAPGSSGAAVVDARGELIGIVAAGPRRLKRFQREGVAYVLSRHLLRAALAEFRRRPTAAATGCHHP